MEINDEKSHGKSGYILLLVRTRHALSIPYSKT